MAVPAVPVAPPVPAMSPAMSPAMGFGVAAHLVVDILPAHLPLALWALTRVENGR